MLHFIAYRDQTGRDFKGFPWFEITSDDLEWAKSRTKELALMYKDVVLVECEDCEFERQENITWDFVYEHEVDF